MIVAYSYVPVIETEAGAEFAEAMSRRARVVERFPGFLRFEFRREMGRNSRFVIVTWWEAKEDLRRYLSSEEHRATHGKLSAGARAGLGAAQVNVHEVIEVSHGANGR